MPAGPNLAPKANHGSSDRRLYSGVAIGTALIVFVGFSQSYYLKFLFGTPQLRLLLHIHGLVMTAWLLLFCVQVRLVAVHRTNLHRRLGVVGSVVAGLVLVVGTAVALSQGHLYLVENEVSSEPPLVFLPVSLGFLFLFATFVIAALFLRRRADYHKRLMVLSCMSILPPGIDRLPLHFIRSADRLTLFGLNDLCIVICAGYDAFKNRRLHPVWIWGGAVFVGLQVLTLMMRNTTSWLRIAEWMLK